MVVRGGVLKLFLASRSPRRREMLREAGYAFGFEHPGIEDSELVPGGVGARAWVASLAYLKARAGAERAGSAEVVLGADTACVMDGKLIGTPRDAEEAAGMIRAFENREHEVVSGIALVDPKTGRRMLGTESARVWVGMIGAPRIAEYVASRAWEGKAGAYNLSERLAAGWPIRYEGDPSTIMGLPMTRLDAMLRVFTAGGVVA
jgi:septum formation protein